jgi:hypothetical protein
MRTWRTVDSLSQLSGSPLSKSLTAVTRPMCRRRWMLRICGIAPIVLGWSHEPQCQRDVVGRGKQRHCVAATTIVATMLPRPIRATTTVSASSHFVYVLMPACKTFPSRARSSRLT